MADRGKQKVLGRRLCPLCKKRPTKNHANAKYCPPCAEYRNRYARPHNLTPQQVRTAMRFRRKLFRRQIAQKIGCTLSQLSYLARDTGVSFDANSYSSKPGLVDKVVKFYRLHGKVKTSKKFPSVNVRSLVERYGKGQHNRLEYWTSRNIREAARMGGLVPYASQALFFNRPNANAGSIASFWAKRVGHQPGHLHGIPVSYAKQICSWPLKTVRVSGNIRPTEYAQRDLVLWIDMLGHVRPEMPDFVRDAIDAMAGFQLWLFNTDDPRAAILRLMRQRV